MLVQAVLDFLHLQDDDLLHLLDRERREHDDLVDTVEELGPEGILERLLDLLVSLTVFIRSLRLQKTERAALVDVLGAQVGGHDQDGVAEIDDIALSVGHAAVVQDLQQGIPDFGMRLLDLVEQEHAIRTPANRLGELAAFLVADIAGRRTKKARDGVLLTIFGHIDAHQRILIVEHEPGERLGQLGLADAGRSNKDERSDRPAGILEARARPADGIRDGVDGLLLADNALVQTGFHLQELLGLGLHHLADRNAGPLMDYRGDVVHIDDLVQLMLGLPFIALLRVLLLHAHPLGFLLGGALVIALQSSLLLFGM